MNITDLGYKEILYSPLFSKVIISVIILLIGLTVGRIVNRIVKRILNELELDSMIKKTTKIKSSIENMIAALLAYIIYFATIIVALEEIGVSTTAFNIIIASVLFVIIIILFFILNYFFPNVIAGIFLKRKNMLKKGDKIKFGDKEGKIISINLIETSIKTKKGDTIYIPNSILTKKEIIKLVR